MMLGEKALGDKLAKRFEEYAMAWAHSAVGNPDVKTVAERDRRLLIADILRIIAAAIRDVTQ